MKQLFLMATLILVGCTLVSDHERAPLEAYLSDEYGDCRTGEDYTCDDFGKVRGLFPMGGYDYKMISGYRAILKKAGKDVEQLEAEYGDVELGLIALGCVDQAPGFFPAVLRPGDIERDYWCSRKVGERFELLRAVKQN